MQSNHKPPNKHFVVHKSYSQFAGPLRRAISYFVSYLVLGLISKKDYRETRTRGAAAAKGPLLGAWLCQSPPGPLPAYASPIEPVVSLLYIACHGVQTPTDHPGAVGPQEAPTAAQGRTSRVHRPQGGGGRTPRDHRRSGRDSTELLEPAKMRMVNHGFRHGSLPAHTTRYRCSSCCDKRPPL